MRIIIFTKHGATFEFNNVENFQENWTSLGNLNIAFDYVGKTTGKKSNAKFNNVQGWVNVGE